MRSLPQQSVDRIFQKIPELRTIQDSTILLGRHIKAARIALLRNHQSSFLSHNQKKNCGMKLCTYIKTRNFYGDHRDASRTRHQEQMRNNLFSWRRIHLCHNSSSRTLTAITTKVSNIQSPQLDKLTGYQKYGNKCEN
ncbi:hypothetical protein Aduo_005443 [Ancylostoma duodenale]